jgi:hypothetical protein
MHHAEGIRGGVTCCFCYDPTIQDIAAIHRRDAVKLPRFSIAKLMVIVGILALNIAAARAFIDWEWTGLFLIGFALQVGLLCLIRSRIGFRPFWWGFETFGLASVITPIFITLVSQTAGSEFLRLMNMYVEFAFSLVSRLCTLIKNPVSQARLTLFLLQDMQLIILEIAFFLPQLLTAVVGGLIASLIVRRWGVAIRHADGSVMLEQEPAPVKS